MNLTPNISLCSHNHKLIRLAIPDGKHNTVDEIHVIMFGDHWKKNASASIIVRNFYYLHIEKYAKRKQNGVDLDDKCNWVCTTLCSHTNCFAKDCPYCQALVLYPDIELQEIETAILEASGTYEERKAIALDEFRCSAIKPAKR